MQAFKSIFLCSPCLGSLDLPWQFPLPGTQGCSEFQSARKGQSSFSSTPVENVTCQLRLQQGRPYEHKLNSQVPTVTQPTIYLRGADSTEHMYRHTSTWEGCSAELETHLLNGLSSLHRHSGLFHNNLAGLGDTGNHTGSPFPVSQVCSFACSNTTCLCGGVDTATPQRLSVSTSLQSTMHPQAQTGSYIAGGGVGSTDRRDAV